MSPHSPAAPAASSSTSPAAPPRLDFRPDVQGLRGIAVMLVVLYHAGLPGLSGGFVGVDAFFVLSGLLITTHLLESLAATGRIRLGQFYAKRARRLLPAALTVALLTLLASWALLSPLLMDEVVRGVAAAVLYVPNLLLATEGTNYLSEPTPSPVQHFWSLGVEEQFYLLWPLLLLLGHRLVRGRERRLAVLVALVTAASFAACVVVLGISQPWAFFSLPTRAWELGAGGLVALAVRTGSPLLQGRAAGSLAWAGLAALVGSAALFDEATVFPGVAALAPVLGTAALVAGGTAAAGPARLLSAAPLQKLGALSYALYLVHWPLQVIPQAALFAEQPLPVPVRLLLGAAALPLAWLLHVGVEKPGIAWAWLRERSAALTGALAVAASAAIVVTGAGIQQAVSQHPLASPTPSAAASSTDPTPEPQVPADLSPALDAVAADNPEPYAMGCHQDEEGMEASICRAGDAAEAPLVFLVGDSHAAAWYPALEELAAQGRIRLESTTKNSCLPYEVEQEYLGRPYTECTQWRQNVLAEIDQADPDLVILAGYQNLERVGAGSLTAADADAAARWRDGLAATLEQIDAPRVAVMAEVPHQRRAPTHCLARNIEDAPACAEPRETAFDPALTAAEDEAIAEAGERVTRVDLTDHLCDEELCPTVIGDAAVYRDGHHLTQTYSRRLAGPMWQQVEPLLA